jgi:NAD(P)-dependent dehydrogenase (short-subunit alcohol dehydrogenase family)
VRGCSEGRITASTTERGALAGRVALVTGGAAGIGRATVERFLAEGARVVAIDVGDLSQLAGRGGVTAIAGDATQAETVTEAFAAADALGDVEAVVANVGGAAVAAAAHETTAEQWRRVLDLNLTGAYLAMSAAAVRMVRRGRGSIVAVSSVQGMRGFPEHAAYAAAKAGVIGLVRQMAVDCGPHGVRVNAVCPGTVLTEGVRAWLQTFADPDARAREFTRWPALRRTGTPEEIAASILWLAGDESSYVTGHALVVDGGLTVVGHHDAPPEPVAAR